jgi:hypothetical protein
MKNLNPFRYWVLYGTHSVIHTGIQSGINYSIVMRRSAFVLDVHFVGTLHTSERLIDQADQLADLTPVLNSLDRMLPVLVSAISLALGRAATSPMEAAYRPSTHRRGLTGIVGPLRHCGASWRFLEGICPFHEVGPDFFDSPPPTLPTIA